MNRSECLTLLGLPRDFTPGQLRVAYREAVRIAHPDHGGSALAFQSVVLAHQTLERLGPAPATAKAPAMTLPVTRGVARVGARVPIRLPRWRSCTDCGGRGSCRDERAPRCRPCRGTGQVAQGVIRTWLLTCEDCRGTGREAFTCATCAGEGRALVALETIVKVPAGVQDGQLLRITTDDGPRELRVKYVGAGR